MKRKEVPGDAAKNIYFIGNAGTGKSFMVNALLKRETYASERQADSVTKTVEQTSVTIGGELYVIYNIPGLLEIDPEQVERNKKMIQATLEKKELCIILFVLTTNNGRIKNEDCAAYQALKKAFSIPPDSLGFIINQIKERDNRYDYQQTVKKFLDDRKIFFLPDLDALDVKGVQAPFETRAQAVYPILEAAVRELTMQQTTKLQDLKLHADAINELKRELDNRVKENAAQLQRLQKEYEEHAQQAAKRAKERAKEAEDRAKEAEERARATEEKHRKQLDEQHRVHEEERQKRESERKKEDKKWKQEVEEKMKEKDKEAQEKLLLAEQKAKEKSWLPEFVDKVVDVFGKVILPFKLGKW